MRFRMSERLLLGIGAINELPQLVRSLNRKKPLVGTDKGGCQAGICYRIQIILQNGNMDNTCFDKVESDPRIEIAYQCLKAAQESGGDVLIGVGGGSSLDIAKIVSVLLTNGGDILQYVGIDKIARPGLDTILIPTTAGTGSEVTPIAVLSDTKEHLKKGIVSDRLYSKIALIDPELTVSLPPYVTAYTGMDALTHSIEAYTNKYAQPFIDTFAIESIRLIGRNLRKAVSCGKDIEARYNMTLASLYGGLCLGAVNTAAVHALAYPLGGTYDVPHGIANALLLPYVMEFNLPSNPKKYADIAAALGENIEGLPEAGAAEQAVKAVVKLSKDIGIVSKLRELNIPEKAIDDMAVGAMKVTRLLNNNPRPITLGDARQIYRNAY